MAEQNEQGTGAATESNAAAPTAPAPDGGTRTGDTRPAARSAAAPKPARAAAKPAAPPVAPTPLDAAALAQLQQEREREAARASEDARAITAAHEVEGGRYVVGDRVVDANGEPIKEKRAAKRDEDEE